MTTKLQDLALKPRAVAVLVALRVGYLTTRQLCTRISDTAINETHDLLSDMSAGHVRRPDLRTAGDMMVRGRDGFWQLTHDGLGWLQLHGLDASETAKQALYAATAAQAVRP